MRQITLLLLFLLPLLLHAQRDSATARISELVARGNRYSAYHPQEKVYLHFDNTGYYQGETIHFKAYVVRADTERLTDLSRILYVDLLTPGGDVVERRKLKVVNGLASGDIKLDQLLLSGFYEVRAYTRYMTTWGTDACFSRVIPIFNEPKEPGDFSQPTLNTTAHLDRLSSPLATAGEAPSARHSIRYYPEGGHLVQGLESRVAYVELEDNREVRRGTMLITPPTSQHKGMPEALAEGVVLRLDATRDDAVTATLHASAGMQRQTLGYVMMHNGVIQRADTLTIGTGRTLSFPRAALQAGVSQLTLFSDEGHVLAERLFFVCPQSDATDSIRITTTTQLLEPLRKVRFEIQTQPHASLSFSAIDAATATGGRHGNLRTNLLLSSELRGYVAHPERYFEADDSLHRAEADLLMMVQGWRRYDWQVMNGTRALGNRQPIEVNLKLNGWISPVKKKVPVANTTILAALSGPNREVMTGELRTDDDGGFNFDLPDIEGTWSLSLNSLRDEEIAKTKRSRFNIRIDRNFQPAQRRLSPAECDLLPVGRPSFAWGVTDSTEVSASASSHVHRYLLPEVLVKKRSNNWRGWTYEGDARFSASVYYNCEAEADRYIDMGEEIPDITTWLRQKNPAFTGMDDFVDTISTDTAGDYHGVFFRDGFSYHHRPIIWVINNKFWSVTGYRGSKAPYVAFCDNMSGSAEATDSHSVFPLFLNHLKSMYISEDIAEARRHVLCTEVEQLNPVVVYLYKTLSAPYHMRGERLTTFQGFDVASYYEMDYSGFQPLTDVRRTLHWSASIGTDANGRATVEFYNNLTCTDMILSVEGITLDGKLLGY